MRWTREGNIWILEELPFITVVPCQINGRAEGWHACCGGRPVPQIAPGHNSREVMDQTEKYYDARIELTSVQGEWRR